MREIFLAYLFGTSRELEIFRIAFALPSILSDALAVSFVAIIIRLILDDEGSHPPAQVLPNAVWAGVFFGVGTSLAGVLTMPWQALILAPGMNASEQSKLILAGRVCWLMSACVLLSLPLRALMSTRGRIWPGAASQLMRSGGFILALFILIHIFNWRDPVIPAMAAVVGGLTVLVMHIAALGGTDRHRIINALSIRPRLKALTPVLNAIALVLVSQLFLSGGRILDRAVASGMDEGALASLEYSYALLMAIAAVFATSANLILAPRFGRAFRDTGRICHRHIYLITGLSITAAVIGLMLMMAAEPLIRVCFERGAFDASATTLTSGIFRFHTFAIGPLVLSLLLTQVLLLQKRQSAVCLAAICKTVIKIVSLWLVLRTGGDVFDVAKTLISAEIGMSIVLILMIMRRV